MNDYQPPSGYDQQYRSAYQPPHAQPLQHMYAVPPQQQTSGAAVVSLVCGVVGLFGFHACGLFVIGIISGHIALSNIKHSHGRLNGRGIALAGLILNYLPLAVFLVILIIFLFLVLLGAVAG